MYTFTIKQKIDPVQEVVPIIDPITGQTSYEKKMKSSIALQAEKAAIVEAKKVEIQSDVDNYIAAKNSQGVGNPAPTAKFHITKIVNEHDGEFEVVLEEL